MCILNFNLTILAANDDDSYYYYPTSVDYDAMDMEFAVNSFAAVNMKVINVVNAKRIISYHAKHMEAIVILGTIVMVYRAMVVKD